MLVTEMQERFCSELRTVWHMHLLRDVLIPNFSIVCIAAGGVAGAPAVGAMLH
jgi:hypothetical protein